VTTKQHVAITDRFGDVVDVEREMRLAREYVESDICRRKPKNFGRFCWNWMLRCETERFRRMSERERRAIEALRSGHGQARVSAPREPMLTRDQLEAIANDPAEDARMRELARQQLEELV
jgi:hypothetical protein